MPKKFRTPIYTKKKKNKLSTQTKMVTENSQSDLFQQKVPWVTLNYTLVAFI